MAQPTIVLADDDLYIRTLLVETLEDEGYQVEAFGDGLSALQRIRHRPPQLVLLDVAMPELSGDAVLRQLRAESYSLPILIATAATDPARFLHMGATQVLPKPFDLTVLLASVAQHIRAGPAFNTLEFGAA